MNDVNFGDTIDERAETKESKFRKTEYLSLVGGNEYIIRILDRVETKKYGHYVGRGWLECLDDECPICQNNKRILYENPEDYREVEGWCPRRPRFFLNVLDRSDNKVKVLSCGPTLIEDLKVMSNSIRNEQDERVDIRNYDWSLTVKGSGRDKETTPSHRFFGKESIVNLEGQELYNLDNCMIRLEPEEMLDVFNGASLKDVFALRRAKQELSLDAPESDDINEDIKKSIGDIFKS